MTDPRNKKLVITNLLMFLFTGIYTVSPIDLLPDVIPLLGWADDGTGWIITLLFTVYTLYSLRKHGLAALTPTRSDDRVVVDAESTPKLADSSALPAIEARAEEVVKTS